MKPTLQNDLLLRAARQEPVERAPVWFMRQAGRYLPQYREIRAKHDFLTMVKTPELAAEVTIQPVDLIGVDAAIIFSDILTIPEAMGMKLLVEEGKGGPRFPDPIRLYTQIRDLKTINASEDLSFVKDAIKLTVEKLAGRVPLIGFSGAPWTLFCYMVEGSGSKDFQHAKQMIFSREEDARRLLQKLTEAVTDYLVMQIEAGADVVQIFDTWAGILTPDDFEEWSLQYIAELGQLLLHVGEELLHAVLEERDEELVLRLEVEVDRPVGDAGRLGDLAHARGVEARLGEDLDRGGKDSLALVPSAAAWRLAVRRLLGGALGTE